jgi:endonuclease YncB( thermonuclease family)
VADWPWPNTVISRVLDGDSVDADLVNDHVGFGVQLTFPMRLRLNRINAAPSSTVKGKQAKARVLALTAGARLNVTTGKGYKYGAPDGKAGEWMAEVQLPDGSNLSDVLVSEGLAVYWDGQGPRPDAFDSPVPAPKPGGLASGREPTTHP